MKIKYLITASVVALFARCAAQAADVIYAPSTAAPTEPVTVSTSVPNWDGVYVGANGGAAWIHNQFKENMNVSKSLVKPHGYVGGIYVGYNYDLGGGLIAGVESDFALSGVQVNQAVANKTYTTNQKLFGSTRARAGYSFDNFLPYVAAGISYNQLDISVQGQKKSFFNKDDMRFGWTAGAGVDYALTDNILLRAEYRYNDYFEKKITENLKHVFHANDARFGVAYKF